MILSRLARHLAATLLLALLAFSPATATVNSTTSKTIVLGNGVTTSFNFSFVGVAAAYISVILTDASGNETVLTQGSGPTQYQITLNAPVTGAIWGLGGTVTYNPSGTPIPSGSTLTIFRTLPLTQAISLQNQNSLARLGNGAETGLDLGVMQVQQNAETLARTIKAPIVDATPPADLPPIAQRANRGAAFDSQGNLVAGSTPASGVISTAMQPVVNAATLALGRTALGLGDIAVDNIGPGLQDDGAGSVRVNSTLTSVATNQSVTGSFAQKSYVATGPITFTLGRANTLWNGFAFTVYAFAGPITLAPNANDSFPSLASGAAYTIPQNTVATITTDAANSGTWYVNLVPRGVSAPQGYLTPCSATVAVTGCTTGFLVPTNDVTSVSTLYYQTDVGSHVPIYNGGVMMMLPFQELSLTLNGIHLANTLYDVCAFNNGGVVTLATAPAWLASGGGSGNRGATAGISRAGGYWTNTLAITGRNGALTYSIPANQCTIVGTIYIDNTPGQVTFHRSFGQTRKWSAWNFYNRKPIVLTEGDSTPSWSSATSFTWRPARGDAGNFVAVLCGLPEEEVFASVTQNVSQAVNGTGTITTQNGIGINVTNTLSGMAGQSIVTETGIGGSLGSGSTLQGGVTIAPFLGVNQLNAIEQVTVTSNPVAGTFYGTSGNMRFTAQWRG
ncbi:hypothetical protein [Bradyrhizobium sp. RT9a]|uniref:hypothetical protein n=1 Tax=Bradyrhizobium sp. RT9a TaxID=3156384 RepID=UPI0033944E6A